MDVVVVYFIRISPAVWISYIPFRPIFCVFVSEASSGSFVIFFSPCFVCVVVVVLEVVLVCNKTVHHLAPYLQNLSPESTKFLHIFLLHQQTVRPIGSDSPYSNFRLTPNSPIQSDRSLYKGTTRTYQCYGVHRLLSGADRLPFCDTSNISWRTVLYPNTDRLSVKTFRHPKSKLQYFWTFENLNFNIFGRLKRQQ